MDSGRAPSTALASRFSRCSPSSRPAEIERVRHFGEVRRFLLGEAIECVERVERPDVRNLLGAFTLQVAFDGPRFRTLEQLEKKKMLLETLHLGSLAIAKLQGWPSESLETAYQCVIDRNYVNEWKWPRAAKLSLDRKHQAVLFCSHEMDRFRAWIVIQERKGNELVRSDAIDEDPSEFRFVPKMGQLTWVSNERVVLRDKNGTPVAEASLPDRGPSMRSEC